MIVTQTATTNPSVKHTWDAERYDLAAVTAQGPEVNRPAMSSEVYISVLQCVEAKLPAELNRTLTSYLNCGAKQPLATRGTASLRPVKNWRSW